MAEESSLKKKRRQIWASQSWAESVAQTLCQSTSSVISGSLYIWTLKKIIAKPKVLQGNSFPEPRQYFLMNATAVRLELIGVLCSNAYHLALSRRRFLIWKNGKMTFCSFTPAHVPTILSQRSPAAELLHILYNKDGLDAPKLVSFPSGAKESTKKKKKENTLKAGARRSAESNV